MERSSVTWNGKGGIVLSESWSVGTVRWLIASRSESGELTPISGLMTLEEARLLCAKQQAELAAARELDGPDNYMRVPAGAELVLAKAKIEEYVEYENPKVLEEAYANRSAEKTVCGKPAGKAVACPAGQGCGCAAGQAGGADARTTGRRQPEMEGQVHPGEARRPAPLQPEILRDASLETGCE